MSDYREYVNKYRNEYKVPVATVLGLLAEINFVQETQTEEVKHIPEYLAEIIAVCEQEEHKIIKPSISVDPAFGYMFREVVSLDFDALGSACAAWLVRLVGGNE